MTSCSSSQSVLIPLVRSEFALHIEAVLEYQRRLRKSPMNPFRGGSKLHLDDVSLGRRPPPPPRAMSRGATRTLPAVAAVAVPAGSSRRDTKQQQQLTPVATPPQTLQGAAAQVGKCGAAGTPAAAQVGSAAMSGGSGPEVPATPHFRHCERPRYQQRTSGSG